MAPEPATVDDYIGTFPNDRQQLLRQVRSAIHRGVPEAGERIRYGMPAVILGRRYASVSAAISALHQDSGRF